MHARFASKCMHGLPQYILIFEQLRNILSGLGVICTKDNLAENVLTYTLNLWFLFHSSQ